MTSYKSFKSLSLVLALASLGAQSSRAATIAVVDSGTDVRHKELAGKIWVNPGEKDDGVDNDDNGYVDDLNGWNLADNNTRLVDRRLVGTFSPDVSRYFEIQTKMLRGVAQADEVVWLKAKVQDPKFIQELMLFGNFAHGTHVAGIVARDAEQARIMVLRIMGGRSPKLQSYVDAESLPAGSGDAAKEKLIHVGLDALASAQGQGMTAVGQYVAAKQARVANCSFGASRASIRPLLKVVIEKIKGRELTDAELNAYADYFLKKTADAMQKTLVDPAPETLFVMAAGNDGTNNDVAPTAPANIKADNSITVAATLGRSRLATFSNYGEAMVDIAAPGVGILSLAPGDDHALMSGTSQAAPYIANLAGRIMDANPKLTVVQVRRVLMETVDKKDFLARKVRSEGVANPDRAIRAAMLSRSNTLMDAIHQAQREVAAVAESRTMMNLQEKDTFVVPLPNFIH